jgi:two-component system response regulator FixJ
MEQPIFIVDDDEAVRDSLRMMLEAAGYEVRPYENARHFLASEDLRAGCLIADIRMPGMGGLELQEELARRHAILPVIIITGHGDVPLAVRAMKSGAIDFIEKPFGDQTMLDCVARALERGQQVKNHSDERQAARDLVALLTPREREVMDQLVQGLPNKLVAHALSISPRTVEIHRANIMDKLKGRNLSDIVRTAIAAQAAG